MPSDGRWIVVVLLCGSIVAAFRSATTRLVLLSLGALVLFEIAFLTLFHQRSLQPRLIVHLAPLVALAAAAWVPAGPRTPRLLIGAALVGRAGAGGAPLPGIGEHSERPAVR